MQALSRMPTSRVQRRIAALALGCVAAAALVSLAALYLRREPPTVRATLGVRIATLENVPASERTGLRYRPLSDAEIDLFQSDLSPFLERDPLALFHYRGGIDAPRRFADYPGGRFQLTTNRLGLRNAREVLDAHPDLRVLVVGDSHTDGVCATDETYSARLESLLAAAKPDWSVEVLNAGCGGYSFYNYLGTFERLEALQPDTLVVCVFGGNDFSDALALHSAFEGLAPPASFALFADVLQRAAEASNGAVYQGLASARYFMLFPEEIEPALAAANAVSREIVARCRARDVAPLFVYLPPVHEVQWELRRETLEPIAELLGVRGDGLRVLDSIADRYLATLREDGVSVIDLRPTFRAAREPLYWKTDGHLNVMGHQLVASQLASPVAEARPDRSQRRGELARVAATSTAMPGWRELFKGVDGEPFRDAPPDRASLEAWIEFGDSLRYDEHVGLQPAVDASRPVRRSARSVRKIALLGDETIWSDGFSAELLRAANARLPAGADFEFECCDPPTPGAGVESSVLAVAVGRAMPDFVVLVVNANNDFVDSACWAALSRGERLVGESERMSPLDPRWQWLRSSLAFRARPRSAREGVRLVARAVIEAQRWCSEHEAELILVVAPPATADEAPAVRESVAALAGEHGLADAHIHATERLASGLAQFAAQRGLAVVELTPRESGQALHDPITFRLNAAALTMLADAVARELSAAVER